MSKKHIIEFYIPLTIFRSLKSIVVRFDFPSLGLHWLSFCFQIPHSWKEYTSHTHGPLVGHRLSWSCFELTTSEKKRNPQSLSIPAMSLLISSIDRTASDLITSPSISSAANTVARQRVSNADFQVYLWTASRAMAVDSIFLVFFENGYKTDYNYMRTLTDSVNFKNKRPWRFLVVLWVASEEACRAIAILRNPNDVPSVDRLWTSADCLRRVDDLICLQLGLRVGKSGDFRSLANSAV